MEKSKDNLMTDKYLGSFLGAVIGDALGWPNEYNNNRINKSAHTTKEFYQKWTRRCGFQTWRHEEEVNAGDYSDDSQLLFSTARSLTYGSLWYKYFFKVEIPAWLSYERGGGGATRRAANIWKKGGIPWKIEKDNIDSVKLYFNAGGNGAAMRILPHVLNNENNIDTVMRQAVRNGIYTHGHPRALLGAALYACALCCLCTNRGTLGYGELVSYLIDKKDCWAGFPKSLRIDEWVNSANIVYDGKYMSLWDDVVDEVIESLKIANEGLMMGALDMGNEYLNKLGCFDKNKNGSGTVGAVVSIYIASKFASNPSLGLIEAANLEGTDTDTIASMVGGLLGMLHGTEWIPQQLLKVQDYEYIKKLVNSISYGTSRTDKEAVISHPVLDDSDPGFKIKLKSSKVGDIFNFEPFKTLRIVEIIQNKTYSKSAAVTNIKLISEEGQTIYLKTYARIPMGKSIEKKIAGKPPVNTREITFNCDRLRQIAARVSGNIPADKFLLLLCELVSEAQKGDLQVINQEKYQELMTKTELKNISINDLNQLLSIIIKDFVK